jgi:dihydroorotate dehydrogenase
LTLKTSRKNIEDEDKPTVRQKTEKVLPRFGRSLYTDGPKQKELLTYDATQALLNFATENLPQTAIGVSILAGADEDYDDFKQKCAQAKFCELNLKYSFRVNATNESYLEKSKAAFDAIAKEVNRFCSSFSGIPVFIKIPRELNWLPGTRELDTLIDTLKGHGKAGFIIANSLRLTVPPFLAEGTERSLAGGVICGERLFDETINLIEAFRSKCQAAKIPIVATGGLISPEQVLMAFWAGADAAQLCTAFDYNTKNYYQTLTWYLQNRVEIRGLKGFDNFIQRLRGEGAASVYSVPFMYYENFWEDEFQKRIQQDVRHSSRMDVFVMSGKSLSERWLAPLRQRFTGNRGLRLLLPSTEGAVYLAIQNSWGLTDRELDARKERVQLAIKAFNKLWKEATEGRAPSPDLAELQIHQTEKCPFYSFYVFDDKVYVALYPFARPGDFGSPVYVFSAGSHEYERIAKEADTLVTFAIQTTPIDPPQKSTAQAGDQTTSA